jgi:hypothetical protein
MTYPSQHVFAQPSVVTPCPLRLIVPLSRQGSADLLADATASGSGISRMLRRVYETQAY